MTFWRINAPCVGIGRAMLPWHLLWSRQSGSMCLQCIQTQWNHLIMQLPLLLLTRLQNILWQKGLSSALWEWGTGGWGRAMPCCPPLGPVQSQLQSCSLSFESWSATSVSVRAPVDTGQGEGRLMHVFVYVRERDRVITAQMRRVWFDSSLPNCLPILTPLSTTCLSLLTPPLSTVYLYWLLPSSLSVSPDSSLLHCLSLLTPPLSTACLYWFPPSPLPVSPDSSPPHCLSLSTNSSPLHCLSLLTPPLITVCLYWLLPSPLPVSPDSSPPHCLSLPTPPLSTVCLYWLLHSSLSVSTDSSPLHCLSPLNPSLLPVFPLEPQAGAACHNLLPLAGAPSFSVRLGRLSRIPKARTQRWLSAQRNLFVARDRQRHPSEAKRGCSLCLWLLRLLAPQLL